ncbi:hypothetical protein FRB99_004778 [Tulasnella sp. 403]|nr:hypothetical protein FRB99_004778 [Tulasnella sp. 403]
MLAFAITVLLAATSVFAAPKHGRECGTNLSSEEVAKAESDFSKFLEKGDLEMSNSTTTGTPDASRLPIVIPVYWHVIRKDLTLPGGNLPNIQIRRQIAVLNEAFNPGHIVFKLRYTGHTTNTTWFNGLGPGNSINTAVKNALHMGGKGALNVYSTGFVTGSGAGSLGYATFPWSPSPDSNDNGVVILYSTLPGGSTFPSNLGYNLVHQVGHWMGLYHPSAGGCSAPGDYVSDTPAEASPAYGCPIGGDSCPAQPGLDPIHNFMDFTVSAIHMVARMRVIDENTIMTGRLLQG